MGASSSSVLRSDDTVRSSYDDEEASNSFSLDAEYILLDPNRRSLRQKLVLFCLKFLALACLFRPSCLELLQILFRDFSSPDTIKCDQLCSLAGEGHKITLRG